LIADLRFLIEKHVLDVCIGISYEPSMNDQDHAATGIQR